MSVNQIARQKTVHAMIESLEGRQMLSATVTDPATSTATAHPGLAPVEVSINSPKAKPKPIVTTTPSLVHNYFGKLKTSGVIFGLGSRQLDFELLITSQTINSITGHFAVGDNSGDATLNGFEKSNGRFSYSTKSNGFTFKIEGKVTNNGNTLGGHASVKLSSVSIFRASGGFIANTLT